MTSTPPPPRPQWVLDLTSAPPSRSKNNTLADPPGFTSTTVLQQPKKSSSKTSVSAPRKQPSSEEMDTLKLKKAWELALAPAKQLPMNAIGMYMSGNSLQIFSIMMVFMLFKGPITAVFNIQGTFQRLETDSNKGQMVMVKLAFIGCNLLALALGIWKVNGMGLLPTTRSDWLAWETAREPLERAYYVS
nr:er membrane protein complex subunit 4 [Quercus suber]